MPNEHNKLHLACGAVKLAGWVNADLDSPAADVHLDLTKPLSFEGGSITYIFCEHFIEHITREEAVCFLTECYRVLSVNGVVRVSTPNLRFLIATYLVGKKDEWGDLWQPATPCLSINEGMRSWGHQFLYDADELVRVFIEAGFSSISFQQYRESQYAELCGLESRPFHFELIIEATKTESLMRSVDCRAIDEYENQWRIGLNDGLVPRIGVAERSLAEQIDRARAIEVDWAARGEVIAHLEQALAEQADRARAIEADWVARGEVIAHLEQALAEQTGRARAIEADWTVRGEVVAHLQRALTEQTSRIHVIEAALIRFQKSLYGRGISVLSRLSSFIRSGRAL